MRFALIRAVHSNHYRPGRLSRAGRMGLTISPTGEVNVFLSYRDQRTGCPVVERVKKRRQEVFVGRSGRGFMKLRSNIRSGHGGASSPECERQLGGGGADLSNTHCGIVAYHR